MTRLSARDLRAVLECVGEISDADSLPQFRLRLVQALRRLVPADYASFNELEADGTVIATLVEPALPDALLAAWTRYAEQNPLVNRYARTRDGRPYRFSDVIDRSALEALDLYRELYAPLGLRHQIAFTLPSRPGLVRGMALSRGRRDFTDREREALDVARPYLVQAFRNVAIRERFGRVVGGLTAALDGLEAPAVVLDADARIIYGTPESAELLQALGGPEPDGLPPALAPIASAGALPQLVSAGATPVLARPIGVPGRRERVIVFERGQVPSVPELQGFGLTLRQSAVLRGFMRGRSPAEVARELGISVRTVHKHTEHINSRLGTRDRTQAVATALSALRTST